LVSVLARANGKKGGGIMGYVEQRLVSGEQVVIKVRGHWLPNLVSYLILAAFWVCALPVVLAGIGLLTDERIVQLGCCSVISILIVSLVAQGLANYLGTEFALTTEDRVIAKKGVMKRRLLEVEKIEIKSVEFWQPPAGKRLDYGRVTLTTEKGGTIAFQNLTDFERLRMLLGD
jgi:uncharacterized membrane protein YdbT with pleckstrin-like domain